MLKSLFKDDRSTEIHKNFKRRRKTDCRRCIKVNNTVELNTRDDKERKSIPETEDGNKRIVIVKREVETSHERVIKINITFHFVNEKIGQNINVFIQKNLHKRSRRKMTNTKKRKKKQHNLLKHV